MEMNRLLDQVLLHLAGDPMLYNKVGDGALNAVGLVVHELRSSQIASASVSSSIRPVFLPTRRRSRTDRSTVASKTPSSLACTSVPTAMWRSVWVNSIAPQGVSKRPGEPVVMHVNVVATCEITPASDSLYSRLTYVTSRGRRKRMRPRRTSRGMERACGFTYTPRAALTSTPWSAKRFIISLR